MPNHPDSYSLPDPRWDVLLTQQKEAAERGSVDDLRRIRKEGFNLLAKMCKESGDQLSIYLMCCVEEAEKLELGEAEFVFNLLLGFHILKAKDGSSLLNSACEGILPLLESLMEVCKHRLQILELERS